MFLSGIDSESKSGLNQNDMKTETSTFQLFCSYVNTFKTVAKDEKKSGRSSAGSEAANRSSAAIIQNTDLIGGDYERSRNSV